MNILDYLAPAFRGDPLAEAFAEYLDYRCRWSPADFGGGYAWDAAIPARQDWDREVQKLNEQLARLERAEAGSGAIQSHPEEIPTPTDVRRTNLFE